MGNFDGDLFYMYGRCTRRIASYKHGGVGGVWFVRISFCVMQTICFSKDGINVVSAQPRVRVVIFTTAVHPPQLKKNNVARASHILLVHARFIFLLGYEYSKTGGRTMRLKRAYAYWAASTPTLLYVQ